MTRIHRRSVLFLAVALVVVLAGCTGGGGTPTATPADSAGDGGADGGAGDDGGDDSDGDEATGGSDGGDGDDAATPTAAATTTPTPTTTPNATGPVATEQLPTLGELLNYEEEYRYRITVGSQGYVQEGRWYGQNFYAQATVEGESFETYDVDGQQYFVSGGECTELSVDTVQNPNNWTAQESNVDQTVRPIDTTTIDGEEVYVYELQVDGPEGTTTSTIYVNAETGYAVRQVVDDVTIDTWDWGNVEPVAAPC